MVKGHRLFAVLLLILWLLGARFAHALSFERLAMDELFSGVGAFVEDSRGMIWLLSGGALYMYDGAELRAFMTFDEGMGPDVYLQLLDDRWLFITGYRGVLQVDLQHRQRQMLGIPDDWKASFEGDFFYGGGVDGQGRVWLMTFYGQVSHWDPRSGVWQTVDLPETDTHCGMRRLIFPQALLDKDGRLWLNNCHGVFVVEPGSSQPKAMNHLLPSSRSMRRFISIDGDTVLLGQENRIYRLHDDIFSAFECRDHLQQPQRRLEHALYINDQRLLIATNQGMLDCNPKTGHARLHQHQASVQTSLADNMTRYMQLGMDGTLWVLSKFGLQKANLHSTDIHHLNHVANMANSLSGAVVYSVREASNGMVWIGTDNGLNRFNPETGEVKHFLPNPEQPDSVLAGQIWSIVEDEQGKLYLGTAKGLNLFDPDTGLSLNSNADYRWPLGDIRSQVFDILLEPDYLWVATATDGLFKYHRKDQFMAQLFHSDDQPDGLQSNRVRKLLRGADGKLWVGTQDGLSWLDVEKDKFTHVTLPGADIPVVIDMDVLANGDLLVASRGVFRLPKGAEQFEPVGKDSGLSLGTMLLDGKGKLWSAGPNWHFTAFDANDPANADVVRQLGSARSRGLVTNSGDVGASGKLYFGGVDGLFMFDSDLPEPVDFKPPLVFTRIDSEQSKPFDYMALAEPGLDVELVPGENRFSIHFAALDYRGNDGIDYQYRLNNFEQDFKTADGTVEYTNLDPGSYLFEVRYTNSDGVWQQDSAILPITLLPYFWQTWWFKVLVLIVAAVAVMAWVKWRTWRLTQRAQALEDEVEARTREISALLSAKEQLIANVSHEFRTPLTLIQGPLDLIVEKARDPSIGRSVQMIRRNSQRLLRMVEHLLQFSKPLEDKTDLAPLPADARVQLMTEPFRPLAAKGGLTVNEHHSAPDAWIKVPQEPLEKIVTNLLTNAVKYNRKGGKITISTANVDDTWQLQVSDSGIGIDEVDLHGIFERFSRARKHHHETISGAGLGLALVKELVEGYGGTITVSSELGKGSCFTVTFPLCDAPEQADMAQQTNQSHIELELGDAQPIPDPLATIENDIPANKTTILVVEDNRDLCHYIGEVIGQEHRVLFANDGKAGLAMAIEHIPDIIVSDVMMPKMNGVELCKAIKENEATSHIPLVLLTALASEQDKIAGFEALADDYINKPFEPKVLKVRIDNLLAIRSLMQQRLAANVCGVVAKAPEADQGLGEKERKFLSKIDEVVESHLAETEFSAGRLYDKMAMSERLVQRKLKALTGRTPAEFIREKRLARASQLLTQGHYVGQIAEMVGFSSHAYFSTCFKARFSMSPSEFVKQ